MKKLLYICLTLLMFVSIVEAQQVKDKINNPKVLGGISGEWETLSWFIPAPTADMFLLGDTSAAGMYVPEYKAIMEIKDLKVGANFDSGDSMRVILYEANGDDANSVVAQTDTLLGTTYEMADSTTVSTTHTTITSAEGASILLDFIAGTPTNVTITLEFRRRFGDAYE